MINEGVEPKGLGVGGFLIGAGMGWIVFTRHMVSWNVFPWILVFAGAAMIGSTMLSRRSPVPHVDKLLRSLMVGLILSLAVTNGFNLVVGIASSASPMASGSFLADETRTFTGEVDDESIGVSVESFNGPIEVQTWSGDGYKVEAYVKAKGANTGDAEENLRALTLKLEDQTILGEQTLKLTHNVPGTRTSLYSIQVKVLMPRDVEADTDLRTSNGAITLKALRGGHLELRTSNGPLVFGDVKADSVDGVSSNGPVSGDIDAPQIVVSTSNGPVNLRLPCSRSSGVRISTSNAGITLEVPGSTTMGYAVNLSTSNGGINVGLLDMEYSLNTKIVKIAETEDLQSRQVQVTIRASTSNAWITLR